MRALSALLAALAALAASTASPSGHVTVLKCCPHGETLDTHPMEGPPSCMRVDNDAAPSASWASKIFSRKQRRYLPSIPSHWTVHAASRPACGDRARMVLAHPQNQPVYLLFEEGQLFVSETQELISAGRFCVDSTAALVCPLKDEEPASAAASVGNNANAIDEGGPVKTKGKKPLVHKCCPDNAMFDDKQEGCVPVKWWGPGRDMWSAAGPSADHYRSAFTLTYRLPNCDNGYAVRGVLDAPGTTTTPSATLEADGAVRVGSSVMRYDDFCLDTMVGEKGLIGVLGCHFEEARKTEGDLRFTLYPALLFLSVFFLAATLLASCLLPSAYHQLHWRCQTNYVASLMMGDLFLAVTQVSGNALSGPLCVAIAVLMHFLFLAAFFWLNTMCFNIWWTFRDLRPASVDKKQEQVRMRLYEVYAWGGPLIIAGVAASLDHLPATQYTHLLRPGFGIEKCWFKGDLEILPYFFGPLGVLLAINLGLFIATARELTCGLWKADGAKPTTERKKRATLRRVCLKLVVVMGVTWVADVASWVAGGPSSLWLATDIINALQGVLIFAVVGCQPHVWSAVKRLWCLRESRSEASRRALQLSSTSQGPNSLGPDSFTTTTTTNGTPAKLQLQTNGGGLAASGPTANGVNGVNGNGVNGVNGVNGLPAAPPNSETPC